MAYEKLWCDPRELLQQPAQPQALHRLSRDGVTVEFEARPLAGGELQEGNFASIRFKVSDQTSGQPLSGMAPGRGSTRRSRPRWATATKAAKPVSRCFSKAASVPGHCST